jgi:predicted dehydrogenase
MPFVMLPQPFPYNPMTKNKLNFGLVGTGGIARSYADAFKRSTSARLVAVADVREDAAAALAADVDACASFDSSESMCDSVALDAVVICTPPSTHEAIAVQCLSRGIHVLCEKPLTIGAESARRMLDAADSFGAILTMASKFRYVEDVVVAKGLIDSGAIGEIILFENFFTSQVDMSERWNSRAEISGGGVLIDNGTHSLDLTRYFLGPLRDVQVVEGKRVQGLSVEETVRVFIKSVAGAMGSIDLSWSINKELESYINIYGTGGTIRIGWKESKFKKSGSHEWTVFGDGYDKVQAFLRQIENFSRAVLGQEPLRITGVDALASVEVIEAAYEALRQSQWTAVGGDLLNSAAGLDGSLQSEEAHRVA